MKAPILTSEQKLCAPPCSYISERTGLKRMILQVLFEHDLPDLFTVLGFKVFRISGFRVYRV